MEPRSVRSGSLVASKGLEYYGNIGEVRKKERVDFQYS